MILKKRDGSVIETDDSQQKLLHRLYGTKFGRFLLKILIRKWVSATVGWFLNRKISCLFIKSFVKNHQIDMDLYVPQDYKSYNEFFIRQIKPELRPVDMDPRHFISPCDSKLTVLPLTAEGKFTIKDTEYTAETLLRNPELAEKFLGGYVMIFRLAVDDYHRYCYIADGQKEDNVSIPGVYHTVMPLANDHYPIYKENSRQYSLLHTENFGDLLTMEVGALLVGRIVNHHGVAEVKRGQEKGYFQFGGSTVVVMTQKDAVTVDEDILENSRQGLETIVKFGEKIGTK